MEFWQYLRTNSFDQEGLTEGLAGQLAELVNLGHSVADLISHYGGDFGHLPPEKIQAMVKAYRSWRFWLTRKSQLQEILQRAQRPPLPEEAFGEADSPDKLDALGRTARLCHDDSTLTPEELLAALKAGVALWTRCLACSRKQGQLRSRATDLNHPDAAAYDPYVRLDEELDDLAPHRWLAMRRGQREKILQLELELPLELLARELPLFQHQLGPAARERTPESLLQELVLDDLTPWLFRILDEEAQDKAIKAATQSFSGLIRAAPLQAAKLGVVYMIKPRAPLAVVALDREGDLTAQQVIKAEGKWQERMSAFVQQEELGQVVIPTAAPDAALHAAVEQALSAAGVRTIKVRTAALAEAKRPLTDPPLRYSATVASAVVLGRRALDPMKEWSRVDPVNIGIAEYQNDLDPAMLRAALVETAELCRLERRQGKRLPMSGGLPSGSTAMARLNPLVKTLADLRPGMSVHGVVTNISHFGAFINLGLPQEGLVHISELSDRFVSNPNEVVRIGQQVTAHILAVETSRGRISLSLKSQAKVALGLQREGRQRNGGMERPRTSSPQSKSQALAELEKLFKK